MRFIRTLLTLLVLAVACILAYNYWTGNGLTLTPPASAPGINADVARRQSAEAASKAAEQAGAAATKVEAAVSEGALTTKIKSKMILDDQVKARMINVSTTGTVVTLTGTVATPAERERAELLAKETNGVTRVIDNLEIRKP